VTDSQITLGQWRFTVTNNDTGQATDMAMMIVAVPDNDIYHLAADEGQGWVRLGSFDTRRAADTATAVINRLGSSRDNARIGGETAGSGLGSDHPGVEWVTSLDEGDQRGFTERLSAHGTARLWVVPSLNGSMFALIDPNSEERVLGYFDDEASADVAVRMIDMIIAMGPG
jgi:hypothetical protein